ncbi:unnamed protein product, partial [Mesorhabditis spiculigera]
MLRPDIFQGFRMVQEMERDQILYTLTDGSQPFDLHLGCSNLMINFSPNLPVEMLRPDIFNGFRMVHEMEEDVIFYTLTDGTQPFDLHLCRYYLFVAGRIWWV